MTDQNSFFRDTSTYETESSFVEYNLSLRCDKIVYDNIPQIFYRHWHAHFEVLCFVDGEGVVLCNNRKYPVSAGDIMVFNCKDIHEGYSTTGHIEYYCLIIGRDFFGEMNKDECGMKFLRPLFENKILLRHHIRDDAVEGLMAQTAQLIADKQEGHELLVKSNCYQILYHLITKYRNTSILPTSYAKQVKNMDRIYQVISYIRLNHAKKITLEDIARYANTNKYHLSHIFKEYYHKTIWEYLMEVRIERAEKMVTDSELSMKQIASLLGFEDANYFGKVYKRLTGKSPTQVRKEGKFNENVYE